MIIFGTRSRMLNRMDDAPMLKCTHCGSSMAVDVFGTFKYFHIFWIPIFPYAKRIMTR